MRIVVFDSGIGGLSVLHEACRQLPTESYLYYADTRHVPYGIHDKEAVFGFVKRCIDEIVASHKVKAIVIACNTATSAAVDELRRQCDFPVIGMEPAVKPAIRHVAANGKRVLVMATPLTLKEQKFRRLIHLCSAEDQVETLGMPELVKYAEAGLFTGPEVSGYLRDQLSRFKLNDFGALVLGCTHFLFFRDALREVLPDSIRLFDGNTGTVNRLREVLQIVPEGGPVPSQPEIVFMSSLGTQEDMEKLRTSFQRYAEMQ